MAKEKTFPLEFESRKPILFYPRPLEDVTGDILEIGPGRGDLLLWMAANFPDKRFVAIEMMLKRYRKLITRAEKRNLTNITLLRGNARIIVPKHFSSPTFERIYVLFPDPWPKPRHLYQRLLSMEFLNRLAGILKQSGDIVFATDWQPYADWVLENVSHVPTLKNMGNPYSEESSLNPSGEPTWFEKKWREEGRPIFFIRLLRI